MSAVGESLGLAVVLGVQVGLKGVVGGARGGKGIGGEHVGLGGLGLGEGGVGRVDIGLGQLGGAGSQNEGKSEDGEKNLEELHYENPPEKSARNLAGIRDG